MVEAAALSGAHSPSGLRPRSGGVSQSCLISSRALPVWASFPFPLHRTDHTGGKQQLPPSTAPRGPLDGALPDGLCGQQVPSGPSTCKLNLTVRVLSLSSPEFRKLVKLLQSKIHLKSSHAAGRKGFSTSGTPPATGLFLLTQHSFQKHFKWTSWGLKINIENEQDAGWLETVLFRGLDGRRRAGIAAGRAGREGQCRQAAWGPAGTLSHMSKAGWQEPPCWRP